MPARLDRLIQPSVSVYRAIHPRIKGYELQGKYQLSETLGVRANDRGLNSPSLADREQRVALGSIRYANLDFITLVAVQQSPTQR